MTDERLAAAQAAMAQGRWDAARAGFESVVADTDSAEASFGLATALWWLGENHACVERCGRAYTLFRRSGDVAGAAQCAVWLAITYKANFANAAAANGWIARAERLLAPLEPGPLHGWSWVARAYRLPDLDEAEHLSRRAFDVAREAGDVDLELVALSQLGVIRVGRGETEAGFALIDEAVAAVLAGERSTLDTVVYTCCDMLNACELANDIERAAQWCSVADGFVETYGCPFLYAECRISYGNVLAARGRWDDAEQELMTALQITEGACPGLHGRALIRLTDLRIRQGRLEEAEQLLALVGQGARTESEEVLAVAALHLARGDAVAATAFLGQRLPDLEGHNAHLTAALDLLVDAHLASGDVDEAHAASERLSDLASSVRGGMHGALAAGAAGRVAMASGEPDAAVAQLQAALAAWSDLELPFEGARTRFHLGLVSAGTRPDVAIDHGRHALSTFEALGASLDADRTAAFLRSMGVNARTGAKGVGQLTRREREVLRLLGAGLSNPEIGERLHVSRKTAAHHVSSILAKLNLRNRAEAAAYAVGVTGTAAAPSRQG